MPGSGPMACRHAASNSPEEKFRSSLPTSSILIWAKWADVAPCEPVPPGPRLLAPWPMTAEVRWKTFGVPGADSSAISAFSLSAAANKRRVTANVVSTGVPSGIVNSAVKLSASVSGKKTKRTKPPWMIPTIKIRPAKPIASVRYFSRIALSTHRRSLVWVKVFRASLIFPCTRLSGPRLHRVSEDKCAGRMKKASNRETNKTEITMMGTALMICPRTPVTKSSGAKAAMVVNTPTATGAAIPRTPANAAPAPFKPASCSVKIFSPATMASSTTMPSTTMRAKRETILMVTPK